MFWGFPVPKTLPNYPQTKGFALKHHQNDSRQLFWKVKILHFFQNFNLENEKFPSHFLQEMRAENSKKLFLPKNRDFMMRKWFFDKSCCFYIILGMFFQFPRSEMHFEAFCGVFLAKKSKTQFFHAKNSILELNLATFADFGKNTPLCA